MERPASLRILQVITTNQRRGAEMSAITLRGELRRRGHAVTAVALAQAPAPPRLEVPALTAERPLSLRAVTSLRRTARGADVVIAHGSTTLPACGLALFRSGTPFVYANIGDPLFWASTPGRVARVRVLLSRAAGVAARSTGAATALNEVLGVPRERIRVIPNGRDVARFPPATDASRRAARARLRLPDDVAVVAVVGALAPEKRVALALETCARSSQPMVVLIAGDGPLREDLQQLSATLDLDARFLGAVDDVAPVLAAADLLLLTSESEGLPGVLIEAGLVGLPVVATDVGFVRDIVEDGRTGHISPSAAPDALAPLVERALADRHTLGLEARKRCLQSFDMAEVAHQWEALLVHAVVSRAG